ncbi:DUF1064 domain-containing protein [Mogibacterium kristiansenii]|uniref:DUF1064 domain-containing protein n=1 Tax=Mogibacterium kristiansenii TaxID=2606708 RepID=A0A6N7XIA3_9FIRM|nr:DUF1064 domain-containing protein [Mogibacterium kristiansenii]MST70664.1 DUF1064 domain-containing protein [Mogibacterium kristiansenii]
MKYHNRKTIVNGHTFDSKKEANRYSELLLLERAGAIHDLRTQVKYVLIPSQRSKETGKVIERECSYKADFVYTEGGETVVEDVKGYRTKEYIIKRKLMLHVHGIRIREI